MMNETHYLGTQTDEETRTCNVENRQRERRRGYASVDGSNEHASKNETSDACCTLDVAFHCTMEETGYSKDITVEQGQCVDWEGDGESSQKGLEGNGMGHIQAGPTSFSAFIRSTRQVQARELYWSVT